MFQPENAMASESFIENPADRELLEMIPFLESIVSVPVCARLSSPRLSSPLLSSFLLLCCRLVTRVSSVVWTQDVRSVLHQWCSPGPGTVLGPDPVSTFLDGSSKSDPN